MSIIKNILNLVDDIYDELDKLKKEIETDMNYSIEHADIVQYIESTEENLGEFAKDIRTIKSDIDLLNEEISNQNNSYFEDDEDYED